jgi:lysophospholipase L1-like esterase
MRYRGQAMPRPRLAACTFILPALCLWLALLPVHHAEALFIGNSLLTGAKGSGMSASSPQKDYYALVNDALAKKHASYSATRIPGRQWEDCTSTGAQEAWLDSIASHLAGNLDYVIIQLGDNVDTPRELAVFESGMNAFIDRVQKSCPRAKIVWVGHWRHTSRKQAIMASVCKSQGIAWADIAPFRTPQYESHVGAKVTYLDGSTATVTSKAVALHPNDAGMALIAEAIISALNDEGGASL